jgi:two-component system sensor histidine kinase UhpB
LHPEALIHSGLVVALRTYCGELNRHTPPALKFDAHGDLESIPREIALCLYRVTQEALRNVVRHAGADRVDVILRRVEDRAELTVTDDGKGFDISKVRQRGGGMGLVSIRERVRLAGGTVSIVTELGQGTRVCVRVPATLEAKAGTDDAPGPPAIPA